jgi:hypothetical protein
MPISSFGHPNVLHACISLENELLETFPDIFADVLSCFIPRVSMPSPGGGARVVASRTTYSSTTGYVAAAMILSGSRRRWGTYGHGNAAGSGDSVCTLLTEVGFLRVFQRGSPGTRGFSPSSNCGIP